MWLFIISSFMMFAALTSGYIVYTAGNAARGLKIILPKAFQLSTLIIIVSSITMILASKAAKKLDYSKQNIYLWLTIVLGLGFFCSQFYCWSLLFNMGVPFAFNQNASQSFIYVFTGIHLAHILLGVGFVAYSIRSKRKNISQAHNLYRLEISSLFWHFIDILWIYLYVFLLLNQ
ncbi:MAG: ctaE [Daejeonella sp.]|nr:ctaE [Daejeonella sp.]